MDKYHTFLPRIGASMIDWALMIPAIYLVSFISAFLKSDIPNASFFALVLSGIVSVLYVVLMHTFYGQTLGKMLVEVKVVDDSERPVIFGQAVLRSLPQIACLIFFCHLGGRRCVCRRRRVNGFYFAVLGFILSFSND